MCIRDRYQRRVREKYRAMGCGASTQPEDGPTEKAKAAPPAPQPSTATTGPTSPSESQCLSNLTPPTSLVVTGPPASNKGKLVKEIVAGLGLKQINTVGAVRMRQSANEAEIKAAADEGREPKVIEGADLAEEASGYTRNGEQIPPDLMAKLLYLRVKEADCSQGWILDGYPREQKHSEALLKAGVVPTRVVVVKVDEEALINNQCHRRIDPEDSQIYDIRDEIPEEVKARLVIREQDQEEVVKAKIETYNTQTTEMLSAFDPKLILEVHGSPCLLYTSPSPRDRTRSRMPSSA
eukprot:TRINITY_DN18215_c0_g1_i3.p1 TRINITY_DN18215_c0_g1~~TRINITY_DN18215_c0_g1_i3.p1  ORF type:complete len:294 (-),score=82.29 TRINITY_DN18215_c0_g1_i3:28-909(-)